MFLHKILTLQEVFLFIVYELSVRVVGQEMPWSGVAYKSETLHPGIEPFHTAYFQYFRVAPYNDQMFL